MADVRIGTPVPDDAEAIARVMVRSWDETYRGLLPEAMFLERTFEHRLAQWHAILASDAGMRARIVRTGEGEVVGVAMVGAARSVATFADGELLLLYILRDWHRQGLGCALMTEAKDLARASGWTSLGFWAVQGNRRAQRFYVAAGAVAVTERVGPGHVDVGYRLPL